MEKSLKQIIYETNVLVNAHVQLRSFYYGDLLDIIKIGSIDYASCFLSINSASNNANFETFNLELFVFDILASDDSNRTDIENTSKRILNDLITTIRYSNRWNDFSEVLSDVSELKYYDNLQDRLSGWGATLQLKVYSNDCLIGLPIDDYDFDMAGNFELTVLAIVKNTDNDILATKLVSDSDDTIIVPDITVNDSDGSTYQQAAGTNVICTPGGGSGDVELNGTNIGTYTAPNTFAANVTLDGNESGTWNSGTNTWEVVSDPCLDATYQIEDTDDNILYSGSIVSGGNLNQVIQDSTAVLKNTDNTILSTTSINAEASADIIAPDATVENSDATYTDTVVSGGTLVLPDITVTDSDGSTFTQPSVNNVICTPHPPCADAIVNINSVFWDNVASGATENISVRQSSGSTEVGAIQGSYFRIGDSTAVVKNSVNTVISTTSIKAEDSEDISLPDTTINITDQSGNPLDTITFPVYSTVNIDIDSYVTPCADATYDLKDSLGGALSSGSIPSGTNDVIVAPDATVENSDASYTDTVVSGGTLVLPDADIEVNGVLEGAIPSVSTADIQVTDGVAPVTPTSVVVSGNTVTIEVPAASAPVGATLMKTGQTTSYRTGDDGDLQEGRATDFFTLASNNPFGNTDRFTDELGGQTYTNDIVIDWSTYDGSTVLGYRRTQNGVNITWNNAIDGALLVSIGSFTSGWRLPNINELYNLINRGATVVGNYTPFTLLPTNIAHWSSTSRANATGAAECVYFNNGVCDARGKGFTTASTSLGGGGLRYIPCRTFTWNGTNLI